MPLTDAEGGIARHEEYLANTFARCTRWQQECDASTPEQAMAHIYYHALPPPQDKHEFRREEIESYRPFAIVSTSEHEGFVLRRNGSESWDSSGTLFLVVELNVPEELTDDHQELMRRFANFLGKIQQKSDDDPSDYKGLVDNFWTDDCLIGMEVTLANFGRSEEKLWATQGDFVWAIYRVKWGFPNA